MQTVLGGTGVEKQASRLGTVLIFNACKFRPSRDRGEASGCLDATPRGGPADTETVESLPAQDGRQDSVVEHTDRRAIWPRVHGTLPLSLGRSGGGALCSPRQQRRCRRVITFVAGVIGRFMTQSTRPDDDNCADMGRQLDLLNV